MNLGEFLFSSIDTEVISIGVFTIKVQALESIVNKGFRTLFIILMMYVIVKIGNRIIRKFVKKQIESDARLSLDPQKAKTLGGVLRSVLRYMTYFIGSLLILSDVFSGISVAIASVGGVALGFGAQSLIKDIINGFFILFEGQYGVGDHVTIGQFSGVIDTIGIRTTVIKGFTGDTHLIPNGSIIAVTNHSRGNIKFMVEIAIAYEEDIDNAIKCIEKVCKDFEKDNEDVTEPISVLGVSTVNQNSFTIRVAGRTKPLKQWGMEAALRKELKIAIDKEGIKIPYAKV